MPKQSTASKVAGGLGVTALAAAGAAAYLLSGTDGKKRKAKVKAWAESAKKELAAKVKQMNNFGQKAYDLASKEVITKYQQAKKIDPEELAAFGAELKKHWDTISSHAKKLGKSSAAPKKAKGKAKRK